MRKELNCEKIGQIIRKLRARKGYSQELLAQVLDIPRTAISQIENGGRELSFLEFQKILELFDVSFEDFVTYVDKAESKKKKNKINKRINFEPEKFKQLLLYILERCGSRPNVGETVLYKLLYFCDFDYFEIYEKPLTGMKYKRLQYGPIPDQSIYNPVINEMKNEGMIAIVTKPYLQNTIQTRYLNFSEANLSVFGKDTEKMIKVVNSVIARLSTMSARQVEEHVHRDYPWQVHKDNEEIDYSSVFHRSGEFAKRDYEKEFMENAASDVSEDLPPLSKEEYEYYISLPD